MKNSTKALLAVGAVGAGVAVGYALKNGVLSSARASSAFPIQVLGSDTKTFTIATTLAATSGKIYLIEVRDLSRSLIFTWSMSTGAWDTAPSCAPGSNLVIIIQFINQGAIGSITTVVTDDTGATLLNQTIANVQYNVPTPALGYLTTGTVIMPARNYAITINVTP